MTKSALFSLSLPPSPYPIRRDSRFSPHCTNQRSVKGGQVEKESVGEGGRERRTDRGAEGGGGGLEKLDDMHTLKDAYCKEESEWPMGNGPRCRLKCDHCPCEPSVFLGCSEYLIGRLVRAAEPGRSYVPPFSRTSFCSCAPHCPRPRLVVFLPPPRHGSCGRRLSVCGDCHLQSAACSLPPFFRPSSFAPSKSRHA